MIEGFEQFIFLFGAISAVFIWKLWWIAAIPIILSFKKTYNNTITKLFRLVGASWLLYCLPYMIRFGNIQHGEGFFAYPILNTFDILISLTGGIIFVILIVILYRNLREYS